MYFYSLYDVFFYNLFVTYFQIELFHFKRTINKFKQYLQIQHLYFVSSGHINQQQQQLPPPPQPLHSAVPSHTTLPSHHNGVRLMLHGGPNPFVKRFPPMNGHQQPWAAVLPSAGLHHHTFPQAPLVNGKLRHSDRDSANFSMASSGDSDTCLPH